MIEVSAQWLSDYDNALNVFGALIGGLATVAIAFLTVFLWWENRALRKAGSEPRVVAYFEVHPDGTGGLNMAIANIGAGAARDVSFSFDGGREEFYRYDILVDVSKERPAINFIPQGEKISFLFAIGFQLFYPKGAEHKGDIQPLNPFSVNLRWKSASGKKSYSESYVLDVRQFEGLPGMMGKAPLLKVVDSLDGIGRSIASLKPGVESLVSALDSSFVSDGSRRYRPGNRESQGLGSEHSRGSGEN